MTRKRGNFRYFCQSSLYHHYYVRKLLLNCCRCFFSPPPPPTPPPLSSSSSLSSFSSSTNNQTSCGILSNIHYKVHNIHNIKIHVLCKWFSFFSFSLRHFPFYGFFLCVGSAFYKEKMYLAYHIITFSQNI